MKVALTRFLVTTAFLGMAAPAYSASISFRSPGAQLDTDPINDLNVQVGKQFTFTLSIDTTGLANPLKSFTYDVTRDNSEILLNVADITQEGDSIFDRTLISDIVSGSFTVGTVNLEGKPDLALKPNTQLDFGTATYTVQPGLINDGVFDYKLEITEALDSLGNDITSEFSPAIQELEVQPQGIPEPTSILTSLLLVAFGRRSFVRKKK